jgi:hypothetical protein
MTTQERDDPFKNTKQFYINARFAERVCILCMIGNLKDEALKTGIVGVSSQRNTKAL